MEKRIIKIIVGIVVLLVLLFVAITNGLTIGSQSPYITFHKSDVLPATQPPRDSLSYKGETGVDALTILEKKQHAWIEQNSSGLIIAINGRKADPGKHEYLAFYVNGKMANVGPASYITKDTDTIMWEIETY